MPCSSCLAFFLVFEPSRCLLLHHVPHAPLARAAARSAAVAQFSIESGRSRRPESDTEAVLVETAAVAVAVGAIRSSVRGILLSAMLTLGVERSAAFCFLWLGLASFRSMLDV